MFSRSGRSQVSDSALRSLRMIKGQLSAVVGLMLAFSLTGCATTEHARVPVVRIAELEIEPAQLEAYTAAVKEEMESSVRVEPWVVAIYALAEKHTRCKLRFFGMYADEAAYRADIAWPHYRMYFGTTKTMITSRRLIDAVP